MDEQLQILQEWLDGCSDLVFYSGPGVSQESGIPDFMAMEEDHIKKYDVPPETILTRAFFERKPGPFFRWYRERVLTPLLTCEPNATHRKLVEIEKAGKLRMILTQNMDDLHQEAGSRKVIELMGTVMRNICLYCDRQYATLDIYEKPGIPYCDVDMCGYVIGPDIVFYGDAMKKEVVTEAIYQALSADVLIVAGCSLLDQPAASVIHHYFKKKMVLISEKESPFDERANLIIRAPVAQVMEQLRVTIPEPSL